ncbi:MAG: hypothetical protein FWH21_01225 [Kiritimatiellaeota bacterium]|nr:hypothetical protein [Kiritimatiellota bacterium]
MKKNMIVTLLLCAASMYADSGSEALRRITEMDSILRDDGMSRLLEETGKRKWDAPRISSKWHVENRMTDKEKIREVEVARDFGRRLAVALEEAAKGQQSIPPGESLYRKSVFLCDLADWCAGTAGYQNLLLARRCHDLAAVGLARLTADTGVPLDICKRLAGRLDPPPPWMSPAFRMRVLNGEAGANVFNAAGTEEEMQRIWGFGLVASSPLRIARGTQMVPLSGPEKMTLVEKGMETAGEVCLRETEDRAIDLAKIREQIDFFMDMEYVDEPRTLLRAWDVRQYPLIAYRMDLMRSVQKALGLLEFRTVLGFFPEDFVRSEREKMQLEHDIKEAAKWGAKITPIEDSPSFDPIKEAFSVAWLNRPERNIQDDNRSSTAALAYKEIKEGRFLDEDTASIQDIEQRKRRQLEREQNPVILTPEEQERQKEELKMIWQEIERQKQP